MAQKNKPLTRKEKAALEQAEKERREAEEKAAREAEFARRKKRRAILQICVGLVMIFGAGLALALIYGPPGSAPVREPPAKPPGVEKLAQARMQPLFRMSCGLLDKRSVELSVTVESECDFRKIPQAPIRDAALMLLAGKTSGEALYGKDMIRAELTGWLNRAVGENCVKNLYFDEFLLR